MNEFVSGGPGLRYEFFDFRFLFFALCEDGGVERLLLAVRSPRQAYDFHGGSVARVSAVGQRGGVRRRKLGIDAVLSP